MKYIEGMEGVSVKRQKSFMKHPQTYFPKSNIISNEMKHSKPPWFYNMTKITISPLCIQTLVSLLSSKYVKGMYPISLLKENIHIKHSY